MVSWTHRQQLAMDSYTYVLMVLLTLLNLEKSQVSQNCMQENA